VPSKPANLKRTGRRGCTEGTSKKDEQRQTNPIKVDVANIQRRVVNIPVPPGNYNGLNPVRIEFFYVAGAPIKFPQGDANAPRRRRANSIHVYDMAKREDTVFLAGVSV